MLLCLYVGKHLPFLLRLAEQIVIKITPWKSVYLGAFCPQSYF